MALLKISDLATQIQTALNNGTTNDFVYSIFTEIATINDLPKELKGFVNQDNTVLGLLQSAGGTLTEIPNQQYYTLNFRGTLYIRDNQYENVYTEVFNVLNALNGAIFTSGDITYIPVFEITKMGQSDVVQGSLRIPLYFNARCEVIESAILSESISISIDGTRVRPLSYSATKVKGMSEKLRTDETMVNELTTNIPVAQTLKFTMKLLYTESDVAINAIEELYSIINLSTVHKLEYSDTNLTSQTYSIVFDSIIQEFTAGGVAIITITASISKEAYTEPEVPPEEEPIV